MALLSTCPELSRSWGRNGAQRPSPLETKSPLQSDGKPHPALVGKTAIPSQQLPDAVGRLLDEQQPLSVPLIWVIQLADCKRRFHYRISGQAFFQAETLRSRGAVRVQSHINAGVIHFSAASGDLAAIYAQGEGRGEDTTANLRTLSRRLEKREGTP